MNLNELKINGVNEIELNDSLETSLLSLKISINENTVIPESNELTIYVDTNSTPTENRKTYTFSLEEKLSIGDVFIAEPIIKNKKIELKAYIERTTDEIEDLEYQDISLFAGTNYIYTNYENATIDIMYPKNNDLVKYYLNNILYSLNNKDKILSLDDIYFKDAFTKVDDNINASFNNLSIDCLSSNNNKFNLDSDGNLTVNSITASSSTGSDIDFDEIYPIGSVYLSVNSTNPSVYFGGTWEQINGYYLYAGNTNETGGSNTSGASSENTGATTLTLSQIPSHSHSIPSLSGTAASNGTHAHNIGADFDGGAGTARYTVHSRGTSGAGYLKATSSDGAHTHTVTTSASNTGSSGSTTSHTHTLNNHTHTINPPFYSLYVFKRTA